MLVFRELLIFVTIVFGGCSANIPLDQVRFNIFENNQTESLVSNSIKSTEIFFADENIANIIANTEKSTLSSVIPFIAQLTSITSAINNLLAENGNWMKSFARAIANESRRDLALYDVHWMQTAMKIFQGELIRLSGTNIDKNVIRKRIASFMHSDLDRMNQLFAHQYSIFKKSGFPLMSGPVLIELALLIAIFTPLGKILVPMEVKNPQIACETLDTLLDYRLRTVSARLEKIHTNNTLFMGQLATGQKMPNSSMVYNQSMVLKCQKITEDRLYSTMTNAAFLDEFGAEDGYYVPSNHERAECLNGYASYVRHSTEKMFPVQLLRQVCNKQKPNTPTGFGWLTIQIKNIRAYGSADGSSCDISATSLCDPYVKLFINDEKVIQTDAQQNICCFNVNATYQSIKIPKASTIKIEVWDDDSGFFGTDDDLVLRTEGDVNSFMNAPIRDGAVFSTHRNSIETISIWQDEWE